MMDCGAIASLEETDVKNTKPVALEKSVAASVIRILSSWMG